MLIHLLNVLGSPDWARPNSEFENTIWIAGIQILEPLTCSLAGSQEEDRIKARQSTWGESIQVTMQFHRNTISELVLMLVFSYESFLLAGQKLQCCAWQKKIHKPSYKIIYLKTEYQRDRENLLVYFPNRYKILDQAKQKPGSGNRTQNLSHHFTKICCLPEPLAVTQFGKQVFYVFSAEKEQNIKKLFNYTTS